MDRYSKQKKYYQANYVHTSTGHIRVAKRPKPYGCELCGKNVKKLNYHHFKDLEPILGIWLCQSCHSFVENVDRIQSEVVATQARIAGYYTFVYSLLDSYKELSDGG